MLKTITKLSSGKNYILIEKDKDSNYFLNLNGARSMKMNEKEESDMIWLCNYTNAMLSRGWKEKRI